MSAKHTCHSLAEETVIKRPEHQPWEEKMWGWSLAGPDSGSLERSVLVFVLQRDPVPWQMASWPSRVSGSPNSL